MRVVVTLGGGGNALLERGEPMTAAAQRANLRIAAMALAELARNHQIVVAHGNGPQVGLLALQDAAYDADTPWPLDVLGAETKGMIGYLIEHELMNALPDGAQCATLLSRVEVDTNDTAFDAPSKPIGPVYSMDKANKAKTDHGWQMDMETSGGLSRVVPSPWPQRIIGLPAIKALLALDLHADALLLITDVRAVFRDWGTPDQLDIGRTTPSALDPLDLAPRSMGPKVTAATTFVRASGKIARIGKLPDARAILDGLAGTRVLPDQAKNRRTATAL
jgi:carbamate kinase